MFLLYNAAFYSSMNVSTQWTEQAKCSCMLLYFYKQYREMHRNTRHSNTSEHPRHLFIQLVYKSLYCLVNVILPFAVSDPDVPTPPTPPHPSPLFLFFLFAPPNPSEVTTISTRVNQSRHTSVKHTRPVLCHRVSVFISSSYDF